MGSKASRIGSATASTSPACQRRRIATHPPAGASGISVPLSITTGGPSTQAGTRTRSVIVAEPDTTDRLITGSSGKPVSCCSTSPAARTREGMNRLT